MSRVILKTSHGDITLELNSDKAPVSCENFLRYVEDGFYDGTIFHRLIDGFMIQGGGMDEQMQPKPTRDSIKNEADNGLKNLRGTVAMARTMDPHSATAQFFINLADNAFLDYRAPDTQGWGYAVFAEVVDGMDRVDAMRDLATGNRGFHQDVPLETIRIESAQLQD